MNTKDLIVFLKVYDYKNMTKAAQELFLTTQGVSKTIMRLENEFQVIFFQRTSSGLIPTTEAHQFKINAQKLIDDFSSLQQTFSSQPTKIQQTNFENCYNYWCFSLCNTQIYK